MQAEVYGIYRAKVTSNVDPTNSGRIKVICPQVAGIAELNWAEPADFTKPIPNTGDNVWLYFNGGETFKPIYLVTKDPYTWQIPVLNSGWASGPGGGSVQSLQYRIDNQDNVYIIGTAHTTSTTPSSTIFTLPNLYIPKIEQRFIAATNSLGSISGNNIIQILFPSGNVVIYPTPSTSGTDIYINAFFPRGNIA